MPGPGSLPGGWGGGGYVRGWGGRVGMYTPPDMEYPPPYRHLVAPTTTHTVGK